MDQPDIIPATNQTPNEQLSYEQAFAELEAIVSTLETSEHPLEATLKLFERGQVLVQHCTKMLDQADFKVQQLSGSDLVEFKTPEQD